MEHLRLLHYKNEITELAEGIDFFETRGSRIGNFVRNASDSQSLLSLVIK